MLSPFAERCLILGGCIVLCLYTVGKWVQTYLGHRNEYYYPALQKLTLR